MSLTGHFDDKRKNLSGEALDKAKENYFIQAHMRGSDDKSIAGIVINTSGRQSEAELEQKNKDQQIHDLILNDLIEDMRQQLADLEAQMARRFENLKAKYGEDVIGGMAKTFLTDEELEGLETDEQKLKALANKMLDENGNIKPEYAHLEEAKYIRDWQRQQMLKATIEKYNGRDYLTAQEQREVLEIAEKADLVDNKARIALSENTEYQETVDQKIDESRDNSSKTDHTTSYGFS